MNLNENRNKFKLSSKISKFIFAPVMILAVGASPLLAPLTVQAAVYYEKTEKEIVTKGVIYEQSRQATSSGLLDIHVLTADITDPYIEVKPVQSANGYGLRETVMTLLADSGAVAGVNADYFDMSASPVTSFGPVIIDGDIVSVDNTEVGYASLFIGEEGNPFIEYVTPVMEFKNNGYGNIKVHSYNKFKNDFSAMYFDRRAIADTSMYDEQYPDTAKIVVEDGVITKILIGETAVVPENGFVIIVASTYFQYFGDSVKVGDTAEMSVTASFDFDAINAAIGGAGKILENGSYSNYGYVVGPTSRQPRTAVGLSQDGSKLIMVVVDGRSHSAGATHEEMANIMLRYGAWNAMHLDGGGSSTMAVNAMNDTALSVVNTLSEGSQRKVVNGLGIYNSAPWGELESIMLNTTSDIVFSGGSIQVYPFGVDAYYNKISLAAEGVTYSSTDPYGRWEGNTFYPGSLGNIIITVSYGGMTAEKMIENTVLAQLDPSSEFLKLSAGGSAALSFSGISSAGVMAPVSGVQYEMVPADLGTIENNVFTAKGGSGYIKCSVGNIVTYIGVSIGSKTEYLHSFNEAMALEFLASAGTVTGSAYLSDAVNTAGNTAVALDYAFGVSESTQAAYVKFANPITIKSGATGFMVSAYGDGSGRWLRARLLDADGVEYLVDLTKEVNFTGWQQLTASIPAEAVQPVQLERFYVASLSNLDTSPKIIYFDDLFGVYTADYSEVDLPEANRYSNPYNIALQGAATAGFDITIAGDIALDSETKPDNYSQAQKSAVAKLRENTAKAYLAGSNDIEGLEGVAVMGKNYLFSQEGNYATVRLSAANGGLASTSPMYWAFANEAKNSTAEHIIIILDKSPTSFTHQKEFLLFQSAVEDIITTGKNVLVVSTEGTYNNTTVRNGVNYINIGGLFKGTGVNNDFSILRIRINGADIRFDIQKVF